MNKIEKIKAEIERLQSGTLDENSNFKSQYDQGIFDGLSLIDNFIDSIEEEPVSNDLEEAAWTYYDKNKPLISHELDLHKEMISFFISGAQWQKEQLMENAVGAVIHPYDGEIWVDKDLLSIYNDCQRVKLIIIEEE